MLDIHRINLSQAEKKEGCQITENMKIHWWTIIWNNISISKWPAVTYFTVWDMGKSQEIVISNFSRSIMEFVFVDHSLIAWDTVNHFPRKNVGKSKRKSEHFASTYTKDVLLMSKL